jgi:hypothetical protein
MWIERHMLASIDERYNTVTFKGNAHQILMHSSTRLETLSATRA